MIWYYIFFFISFCFIIFDRVSIAQKDKKNLYIFYLIICIIFFGGRYECDLDYEQYVFIYENSPLIGEKNYFIKSAIMEVEYGFIFCCSFLKLFSLPAQSIFILCAILTFVYIGKSIWCLSINPFLCIFLYVTHFFNLPFIQIRFGVAMALVLYACICLERKQLKKHFTYLLIALSFHSTALAGFVPFFLSKINLTRVKTYIILFFALSCLFLPIDSIVHNVVNYIGRSRYIAYLSETSNKLYMFIFMLITTIPFIYYKKFFEQKTRHYNTILGLALGSFLLLPLGEIGLTFTRFSTLLFIAIIILISYYLAIFKKDKFNISIFYVIMFLYAFIRYKHNITFMDGYQFFIFNY